ncbi:hypothetical protein GCM10009608_46890 [Pseudonocardia alaniniphila]
MLQPRRDQSVLGAEVLVEARPGDVGVGDELVDAHRADAVPVEQSGRAGDEPFRRKRTIAGRRHLISIEPTHYRPIILSVTVGRVSPALLVQRRHVDLLRVVSAACRASLSGLV